MNRMIQRTLLGISTISGALFVALLYAVWDVNYSIMSFNQTVFQNIVGTALSQHITLWKTITTMGGPVSLGIATCVLALYLCFNKQVVRGIGIVLSMVSGFFLVSYCKTLTESVRPEYQYSIETTFSFPSGHTALSALFLLLCIYSYYRIHAKRNLYFVILCGLVLLLGIAMSRLMLGEHWIVDVLGGYLLAISFGTLTIYVLEQVDSKVLKQRIVLPKT
jgi:membrane-associated phospholipid phosphatase